VYIHELSFKSLFLLKPISAYLVKIDYCEFNWWNSCSYFNAMFGYVNLMIIKLLVLNLYAWNVYICIICVLVKNGEVWYCCCWIVNEFMVNWCYCCYEMLLLMIHAMGIHNYGVVMWIELLLWKIDILMNCIKMVFDFKFDMVLLPFYVHKRIDKLWGRNWILGDQN